MKKFLAIILLLIGEILVVYSTFYFGSSLEEKIIYLIIGVSSIVYFLLFSDLLFAWINLKDRSQKQIGSIGIRWVFIFAYVVSSTGLLLIFNLSEAYPKTFDVQLISQAVLLFFLFIGLHFSFSAAEIVNSVYTEQLQRKSLLIELKKKSSDIQNQVRKKEGIPKNLISKLSELDSNLRFISPSDNAEAHTQEQCLLKEMENINNEIRKQFPNVETISNSLDDLEAMFKERKSTYSL